METILIVDDEKNYLLILSAVLTEEGFETITANSAPEALERLKNCDVDLVLTDMKMPGMDGIQLLEHVKQKDPELPVIMMTAHGTIEKAVEAMQKGAFHYILKPFDNDTLTIYTRKALSMYKTIKENRRLRNHVQSQYQFGNIIGKSQPMQSVFDTIRKIAPASATVLIEGENGTGKELAAKAIHFNSPRKNKPFIPVNCSALAENLLESELFGHEKGAFTGAISMKKGRFELADGGSLFLDEIGELSSNLQVKLLRVLQEKTFERVGGMKPLSVDIRVIAATNKQLSSEVSQNKFRQDLFYRLNVLHITLPPLRERTEDIPLLVRHFIQKFIPERKTNNPVTGIDRETEKIFNAYHWPGNVRELENVIERAMILSPGNLITLADLPQSLYSKSINDLPLDQIPPQAKLNQTLTMIEKMMIQRALKIAGNVQSHAAQILGIGKSGLNQKIKKYKLDKQPK